MISPNVRRIFPVTAVRGNSATTVKRIGIL